MICEKTSTLKSKPVLWSRASAEDAPPPGPPENFSVDARTDSAITISWDAVLPEGVTVRVQWQALGFPDWDDAENATTPHVIGGLPPNFGYDIRIRAENEGGESDWVTLNAQYTCPSPPTGFAAATGEPYMVDLTWNPLPEGCTASLYVGPLGDTFGAVGLTGTSYSFNTASLNYFDNYRLRAVSDYSGLESVDSETVSATSGDEPMP